MTALKKPLIAVNLKTYPEVSGARAVALAKVCESVSNETGVSIAVAPPMTDLAVVVQSVDIPVLSQHIDAVQQGSTTGHVPLGVVSACGGAGTLLNHSERRMRIADIASLVVDCRKAGLATIVCTNDIAVTRACAALEPDFVAIEPPELIGGDVSVTTANPAIVRDSVDAARGVSPGVGVLCGAGVKNGVDVAKASELGTDGVLLASGVVKAGDPRKALLDLASGFNE
ncbi:MAG: triose-phosphate isomerase [Methanobacteriota archaeon]|nr:MAG: triose-phosphate isomerase [Euryarchaeota archaeon]